MYSLISSGVARQTRGVFIRRIIRFSSVTRKVRLRKQQVTVFKITDQHCNASAAAFAKYSTFITDSVKKSIEYSLLKEWLNEEDLYSAFEGFRTAQDWASHTVLYQVTSDPVLEALAQASSIGDVFNLMSSSQHTLNERHASQAIVTLWGLQRFYCKWKADIYRTDYGRSLREFIRSTVDHPQFVMLVQMVDKSAPLLSNEAIASLLLCLRRFDIRAWDISLHTLLCTSLNRINQFQLPELAKWCLALAVPSHTGRLISPAALPALENHIDKCRTLEEAKLISICFISLATMINRSGEFSKKFVNCIKSLIDSGVINASNPAPELIKFLRALNLTSQRFSSEPIIRIHQMLYESENLNDSCSSVHISWIRKSWEGTAEPVSLLKKLDDISRRRLETEDMKMDHLALLHQISYRKWPDQRQRLENHLTRILTSEEPLMFESELKTIFRVIHHLRITDPKIIQMYWNIVVECMESRRKYRAEDFIYQLQDIVNWYSFLNLGANYRSPSCEFKLINWISSLIDWEEPVSNVRTFCRLASFVIAFGGHPVPDALLDKLLELEEQLRTEDIHNLSRALRLSTVYFNLNNPSPKIVELGLLLDRRTCIFASEETNFSLREISHLLGATLYRSYQRRSQQFSLRKVRDTTVTEILLKKCESQLDEMDAHFAEDILHFLNRFHHLPVPLLNRLSSLTVERHSDIGATLVVKIFNLFYNLGFTPSNMDKLTPIVIDLLSKLEDDEVYGMFVLEAALSLILTDSLPSEIVQKIFSVNFLEKLDAEVLRSYDKIHLPIRIQESLMQLNRAVCISMPECDVPWFHENYCQSRMNSKSPITSSYHVDVYQCLTEVLGSGQFVRSQVLSPYYHHIDFELRLDSQGKPVAPSPTKAVPNGMEKIAVLTLLPSDFTIDCCSLSGRSQLNRRQLEILGYRVVSIPYHHWNSLALSNPQAKCDYIRNQLFGRKRNLASSH